MNQVIGYNTIREVPLDKMLVEILKRKKAHMRLSQACASYRDGKYELSYSFSDDETLEYETLRIIAGLDELVPTISDMYPYAAFYENEMRELFGVNIRMIEPDYKNKFYRITAETPFLPKEAWMERLTPAKEKKPASQETVKPVQATQIKASDATQKNAADQQDKNGTGEAEQKKQTGSVQIKTVNKEETDG